MPNTITIINMKGGVGKTTLSVNISYILAKFHQKKVLLIDIDPQFNATQYLVEQSDILEHFQNKKTVYDILMPSKEEEISLTVSRKKTGAKPLNLNDFVINVESFTNGKLDLIPSSLKLINFETNKRGVENLLNKFIADKCGHYDFVIIDCPPTLSLLTLSAYLASEYYLIPIKPDYLSSLGLPLLERGLEEYEELHGHSLELLGIVFTMVQNNANITTEVIESIKDSGWDCFDGKSSHSSKVSKSVLSLTDFYRLATYSRYANEFKKITEELLNKI